VAQFWSFAADLYKDEQGRRIFPLIGIGSSVGAVAGAWIADKCLFVGPFGLMLLAAGVLLLTLGLTYAIHRREQARTPRVAAREPIGGESGFALVLKDRYLLVFAALMLVLNCATKTGDYVFDRTILDAAHGAGLATRADAMHFVGQLRARYFEWTNAGGVLLQLFVVSRVIKHLGVKAALPMIPAVSLIGYGVAFAMPLLGTLFVVRVAEMSLDYSLSNTTRQALWLVTSRDAKYKAKQVIDAFVVRAGDAASAAMVWVSARAHLDLRVLLGVNLALTGVWCIAAVYLGRAYAARAPEAAPAVAEAAHA
jgi:AAA family ATP:ADP antiporter